MPITITFERGRDGVGPLVLGPFEWIQLTYTDIRVAPDGDVLAWFGEKTHPPGHDCGACIEGRARGMKFVETDDWILDDRYVPEGAEDFYSDFIIAEVESVAAAANPDTQALKRYTVIGMYEGEEVFAHVEASDPYDVEVWNAAVRATFDYPDDEMPFDAESRPGGGFDTYTGSCVAVLEGWHTKVPPRVTVTPAQPAEPPRYEVRGLSTYMQIPDTGRAWFNRVTHSVQHIIPEYNPEVYVVWDTYEDCEAVLLEDNHDWLTRNCTHYEMESLAAAQAACGNANDAWTKWRRENR